MKFGVLTFGYQNFLHFERQLANDGYYAINLGDNAQTIAVRSIYEQLGIPGEEVIAINRDELRDYRGERVALVMNAVFKASSFPLSPDIYPIFTGFRAPGRVISENAACFRSCAPVGCRDHATTALMQKLNIDAFTSGCATLALAKRAAKPAVPKLFVVYGSGAGELPAEVLKHIPSELADTAEFVYHRLPVSEYPLSLNGRRLAEAYEFELLARFRTLATLVLTPLHHVAAPCLAMGIPVVICRRDLDDRFGLLSDLVPVHHTPQEFAQIDWAPKLPNLDAYRLRYFKAVSDRLASRVR